MGRNRLEAFSDGVFAILITIMVLELKVPRGTAFADLLPAAAGVPQLRAQLRLPRRSTGTTTITCCTWWPRVSGGMLWANLHLLFWLSLVPFVTGWMGENHFAAVPTALYGVVLLGAAIAYWLLQGCIIARQGPGSTLAAAVGRDLKGKISPLLYLTAIPAAFFRGWIADAIYVAVALIWLVPDRRIERAVGN